MWGSLESVYKKLPQAVCGEFTFYYFSKKKDYLFNKNNKQYMLDPHISIKFETTGYLRTCGSQIYKETPPQKRQICKETVLQYLLNSKK